MKYALFVLLLLPVGAHADGIDPNKVYDFHFSWTAATASGVAQELSVSPYVSARDAKDIIASMSAQFSAQQPKPKKHK